jgi:hypothetical protein
VEPEPDLQPAAGPADPSKLNGSDFSGGVTKIQFGPTTLCHFDDGPWRLLPRPTASSRFPRQRVRRADARTIRGPLRAWQGQGREEEWKPRTDTSCRLNGAGPRGFPRARGSTESTAQTAGCRRPDADGQRRLAEPLVG